MKPRYEIDYDGLREFLTGLSRHEVEAYPKVEGLRLFQGLMQFDAERFEPAREFEIAYGDPFLCDLLGNDLSIGIHTRRKYKLPNGRAVHCIFDRTIIADCWWRYGTALNGCWKIPSQFLTPIDKTHNKQYI